MIEIQLNTEQSRYLISSLENIRGAWPRAASRGINRTAQHARTLIKRSLSKITGIKPNTVNNKLYAGKATLQHLAAYISIKGSGIPLIALKARKSSKGVTYNNIIKGRTLLEHAFIQTMKSGHKGVFLRTTKKKLPIKEQYGPSLVDIYNDAPDEAERIYDESQKMLTQNIHDQVNLILSGKRAG